MLAGVSAIEKGVEDPEEVAAIADDMFVPSGVSAILKRLKSDHR